MKKLIIIALLFFSVASQAQKLSGHTITLDSVSRISTYNGSASVVLFIRDTTATYRTWAYCTGCGSANGVTIIADAFSRKWQTLSPVAGSGGGGVTGSGTTDRVAKWTSGSAIGNSDMRNPTGQVGINGSPGTGYALDVQNGHFRTDYYESTTKYGSILTDVTGGNTLRAVIVADNSAYTSEMIILNTSSTDRAFLSANGTTGEFRIGTVSGYFTTLYAWGNEKIRLNNSGVGVNKTPTNPFDVLGTTLFTGSGTPTNFTIDTYDSLKITNTSIWTSSASLLIRRTTSARIDHELSGTIRSSWITDPGTGEIQHYAGAGGYFQTFYANNAEQMRITSTGVGIGVTATYKLDVNGDFNTTGLIRVNGSSGNSGDVLQSNGASDPTWVPTTSLNQSGTYAPTLTVVANITGTPSATTFYYQRVGDVFHIWGEITLDPTTTVTLTELGISLPISFSVSNTYQIVGSATSFALNETMNVTGDVANARATMKFTPVDVNSRTVGVYIIAKYIAP